MKLKEALDHSWNFPAMILTNLSFSALFVFVSGGIIFWEMNAIRVRAIIVCLVIIFFLELWARRYCKKYHL